MPARSTVMATESKTKMIGLTDASFNPCIYHSCARKRQTTTHELPADIAFNILLHLPAQVLHDVMRHVCREWSLVLRSPKFVFDHLRQSTGGLIIVMNSCFFDAMIFAEMRRGSLEISNFDSGFENPVWTSCNGLVLASNNKSDEHILYVTNPVTKQCLSLPPYPHPHGFRLLSDCVLAFVEASMEYKVVFQHVTRTLTFGTMRQIVVLTIGVDKVWRHIDLRGVDVPLFLASTLVAFDSVPIATGGFMHWIGDGFVFTFNVETETIRSFLLPHRSPTTSHVCLPMGSKLSFFSASRDFFWDVWEMNPGTGEWTVLPSIDLEAQSFRFGRFVLVELKMIPCGWLVEREVLVFNVVCPRIHLIVYNLKTRECQTLEWDNSYVVSLFRPHVNTLVWLP